MIRFANTIDIAREPATVYAYLADLEHTPEWNWAIAQPNHHSGLCPQAPRSRHGTRVVVRSRRTLIWIAVTT